MKLSPLGVDTIELTKRYNQNKNDIQHISKDQYKTMQEKSFEIRQKNLRFIKSLNKEEHNFVISLQMAELGEVSGN